MPEKEKLKRINNFVTYLMSALAGTFVGTNGWFRDTQRYQRLTGDESTVHLYKGLSAGRAVLVIAFIICMVIKVIIRKKLKD